MAIIHLIHGLPGSGKTVFARKLEADTGAVLLNHDAIRTAVCGFDPPKEDFQEYTKRIHGLIWMLTEKFIAHGVDVILDHGFWTRAERDEARAHARSIGAEPRFYRMECSDSMADARVLKRNEASAPGTLYIPPGALDVFRARFEPMGADEPSISIRTDCPNQTPEPTSSTSSRQAPAVVTPPAAGGAPAAGAAHLNRSPQKSLMDRTLT